MRRESYLPSLATCYGQPIHLVFAKAKIDSKLIAFSMLTLCKNARAANNREIERKFCLGGAG
jgi:hypothetical protein